MKLEDLSALIWVKKALTPAFNQKRCVVRMLPEVFGKLPVSVGNLARTDA